MVYYTLKKTTESLKKPAEVITNVAPHYEAPKTWLPGVRVLLAFYAPLLLGLAIGNPMLTLPISIGAVLVSFVDPQGSNAKRFAVLGTSTLGCTVSFALGQLAGLHPVPSVLFAVVLVFIGTLSGAMGSAAMRGGFWIVSAGLYGISTAGVNPGYFTAYGLLLGGLWAIFLSLVPFRNHGETIKEALHPHSLALYGVETHVKDFFRELPSHLALKTAIGRSGARLAAAAGIALCVSALFNRPSPIWIAAAAIAVLNPQVSLFRERGARLVLATALGTAAAIGLVMLSPSATILFVVVAPVLFFASNLRNANYAMWVMLYTAFAFALLFLGSGTTEGTTLVQSFDAKIIDTLIGASIALIIAKISFPIPERDLLAKELTEARLNITASLTQGVRNTERECTAHQDENTSAAAMPAAKVVSKKA